MKNIYFISDVHLAFWENELEKGKRDKLIEFFDFISSNAGELYILGDMFDFWFEWYHVIPKYWFPVLYHLRMLVESGIRINFITGNHDFYTGKYLKNDIGVACFNEYKEFEVNSKRFFVAHGDGYARGDRGYRFLKKFIRNPFTIFLYKTLVPADIGVQLAKWTSHSSRKFGKTDKSLWIEEYYKFAKKKFDDGFDYVVLGHIHHPYIKEEGGKVYVNCGDWISKFSYAKYDGETLTLNLWKG